MNKRQNKRKKKNTLMLAGTSKELREQNPDSISISKQLNIKKQNKLKVKQSPLKRKMNKQSSHRQSKTMPTLSDLEKMFVDSEAITTVANPECDTSNTNKNSIQVENKTSLKENIPSPKTNIVNQNIIVSSINASQDTRNCDDSISIIDLTQTFKPKTINCKEIIIIDDEEPEVKPTQERKRKISMSKNYDIMLEAEILDCEQPQKIKKLSISIDKCHLTKSDQEGSDSDMTVIYEIETSPRQSPLRTSSPPKRFSPLPSTSTDSATILENEKFFMQSLSENESSFTTETNSRQEPEITILLQDDYPKSKSLNVSENNGEKNLQSFADGSGDIIISSYNSNDIVDIDAIIAENETFLTTYKTIENLSAVIDVTPIQSFNQTSSDNNVSLNTLEIHETNQNKQSRFSIEQNLSSINQTRRSTPKSTHVTTNPNKSLIKNNLKNSSEQRTSEVSSGLNCPICLENLRSKECASTICGHIFCMDCIKRAFKNTKRCPTCRKTVKVPGYHRLFL